MGPTHKTFLLSLIGLWCGVCVISFLCVAYNSLKLTVLGLLVRKAEHSCVELVAKYELGTQTR